MGSQFECSKCSHKGHKQLMIEHFIRTHVEKDRVPWTCSLCGFRAPSEISLRNHEGHFRHKEAIKNNPLDTSFKYVESSNPYQVRLERDIISINYQSDFEERGETLPTDGILYDAYRRDDYWHFPSYDVSDWYRRPERPDLYDNSFTGYRYDPPRDIGSMDSFRKRRHEGRGFGRVNRFQPKRRKTRHMREAHKENSSEKAIKQNKSGHKVIVHDTNVTHTDGKPKVNTITEQQDKAMSDKRNRKNSESGLYKHEEQKNGLKCDKDVRQTFVGDKHIRKCETKTSAQTLNGNTGGSTVEVNQLPSKVTGTTPQGVPVTSGTTGYVGGKSPEAGSAMNSDSIFSSKSEKTRNPRKSADRKRHGNLDQSAQRDSTSRSNKQSPKHSSTPGEVKSGSDQSRGADVTQRSEPRPRHSSLDQSAQSESTSFDSRRQQQHVRSEQSPEHNPVPTEIQNGSNQSSRAYNTQLSENQSPVAGDDDEEFEDSQMLEDKITNLVHALEPLKNISKALIALDFHMRRLLPMMEHIAKELQVKSTDESN